MNSETHLIIENFISLIWLFDFLFGLILLLFCLIFVLVCFCFILFLFLFSFPSFCLFVLVFNYTETNWFVRNNKYIDKLCLYWQNCLPFVLISWCANMSTGFFCLRWWRMYSSKLGLWWVPGMSWGWRRKRNNVCHMSF